MKPPRKKRRPRRLWPHHPPSVGASANEWPRWQREAREFIAALEPRTPREEKRRRLLISLAEFLEPGHRERLGAGGVCGVFHACLELASKRTFPPTRRTSP